MLNGKNTSLYLQEDLINKIDEIMGIFPERWKSRNAFVNSAIYNFYRREKDNANAKHSKEGN